MIGEGDRLVDLVREGVDCVLRAGNLQDSSMVARRVALLEQVTCASPDYLARYGRPRALDGIDRHCAVNYVSSATGKPYPLEFMTEDGMKLATLRASVSVTGADPDPPLQGFSRKPGSGGPAGPAFGSYCKQSALFFSVRRA
jgi:DNA-binding transcriptional LysR family regulator